MNGVALQKALTKNGRDVAVGSPPEPVHRLTEGFGRGGHAAYGP